MGYLATLQRLNQLYGPLAAAHILIASIFRRMGYLRYVCYASDSMRFNHDLLPKGVSISLVDIDQMKHWDKVEDLDMGTDFIKGLRRGVDLAVAAYPDTTENSLPLSYCFLSLHSTPMNSHWMLTLPSDGAYIYKAYTRPAFRGLGLNKACCISIMATPHADGRRIFTLIEASNIASRRSFEAIGFAKTGSIFMWSHGARACPTRGFKKTGLSLVSS